MCLEWKISGFFLLLLYSREKMWGRKEKKICILIAERVSLQAEKREAWIAKTFSFSSSISLNVCCRRRRRVRGMKKSKLKTFFSVPFLSNISSKIGYIYQFKVYKYFWVSRNVLMTTITTHFLADYCLLWFLLILCVTKIISKVKTLKLCHLKVKKSFLTAIK